MTKHSLQTLALNITEQEYRDLPYLSQSAIAKYEKGGFDAIKHLYDKQESEALTFGSMVDCIITEGMPAFRQKFVVADTKEPTESMATMIQAVMSECTAPILQEIPDEVLLDICDRNELIKNIKDPVKKVAKIREGCTEYYNLKRLSQDKTIVSTQTYEEVLATVGALTSKEPSCKYFKRTGDDEVEFLYQQKFVVTIDGLTIKMMTDLLIVNHKLKAIIPIDLKTTSVPEYNFQQKFLENRYDIQSRLYWRGLNEVISHDDYFKDFKVLPFKFIVVNKNSLQPLVFEDERCDALVPIVLKFNSGYIKTLRNPIEIGKELQEYLNTDPILPDNIDPNTPIHIYQRLLEK